MKIKKLRITNNFKYFLGPVAILGILSVPAVFYYSYDNKSQVETTTDQLDTFINEEGQICCNFQPGEHKIKVSRNDAYYHQIESVEGYSIEQVNINGWRDNNQVIYVNTEPVTAIGTFNNEGISVFNDFGKIISNELNSKNSYLR